MMGFFGWIRVERFFVALFRGISVGRSWEMSKQQGRLRASWRCGGMRDGSKESGKDEAGVEEWGGAVVAEEFGTI